MKRLLIPFLVFIIGIESFSQYRSVSSVPCPGVPTVTYQGKIYNTVQIGTQCWLKENLDVGTMINGAQNQIDNGIVEKYCYGNNTANCDEYGGLYQWSEATAYTSSGGKIKGICPDGWHLPDTSELKKLQISVNSNGNALKAVGQGTGFGSGTNSSGFSALLGGYKSSSSGFIGQGQIAIFWSALSQVATDAWYLYLFHSDSTIQSSSTYKTYGNSIRCLIDTTLLQILSPNGGENWRVGETDTIKWTSSGITKLKIEYTTNNGINWLLVRDTITASFGKYVWVVPNTPSTQCRVRICDADSPLICDSSNSVFLITATPPGNYSLSFDGDQDYVGDMFEQKIQGNQSFTLECWIKLDSPLVFSPIINRGSTSSFWSYNLYHNGSLLWGINTSEPPPYIGSNMSSGIWHHVAAQRRGSLLEIYLNGILVSINNIGNNTLRDTVSTLKFGRYFDGYNFWLKGKLTRIRISKIARYTASSFTPPIDYQNDINTVGLWLMKEGSGNNLTDSSGNGINGRIYGATWSTDFPGTTPTISLLSPNGGENWRVGETDTIKWTSSGITKLKIEYTTNNGTNWLLVRDTITASFGKYAWVIPNTPSTQCRVRISDASNSAIRDSSDDVFTISLNSFICGTSTVTYSEKVYNTVFIGTQCWLKENLDVGTMIQGNANPTNNGIIEKYCYDNIQSNCNVYGGLYQWNEAMAYATIAGTQGICPAGWHLPSFSDFETCSTAVAGDGNALKAIGQGTGGGAGTNTSGFSALLAGYRSSSAGVFAALGSYTNFWSSSVYSPTVPHQLQLGFNVNTIGLGTSGPNNGYSVRCIKDTILPTGNLKILHPNGGEDLRVGITDTIKWTSTGIAKLKIEYTTNNGTNWLLIRDTITATTSKYIWIIPNTPSTRCRIRISDVTNPDLRDESDNILIISTGIFVCGNSAVAYSGKVYNTVFIGTQCWLKENLDVGVMIQGNANSTDNGIIEKYCYNNVPTNCNTYGGLYQWNEAMGYGTTAGVQGICPTGWHLPSFSDFETCSTAVAGDGNALKAIGQGAGGGAGTNTSGFSALLAGYRSSSAGVFAASGSYTNFWSSSVYSPTVPHQLQLGFNVNTIGLGTSGPNNGYSVRCIKDTSSALGTINVISPNGGENWKVGETDTIKWTSSGISKLKIEYTTNNGSNWLLIRDTINASLSKFPWLIPNTPSNQCKVRITDASNSTIGDTSATVFSIVPPPFVCGTSTVSYSGKTYNTIQIGPQCWLKENLDVGKMIPGSQFQINNSIIEKFCYNNDTANCRVYGGLYEWSEAMQYSIQSRAQGICPQGWHLPDTSDYRLLAAMVNNSGNALKAINQGSGAGAGTNASGFSALLAGFNQGTFFNLTKNARMWSSTQNTPFANNISLYDTNDVIRFHFGDKMDGYSVRCLRDTNISGAYLIKPNGGENWRVGETDTIQWTSSGVTKLKIEYTTNNGTNWLSVRDTVGAAIGKFAWVVPNTPSSQCKVRISDANNAAVRDSSDAVFTISLPSPITVLSPNGGENWKVGEVDTIKWTSSGVLKVKIEYSTNNGAAWLLVRDTVTAAGGKYLWTVPNTLSTNCKVKISDAGNASLFDVSDAVFTIYTPPSLSITAPNGGEIWMAGTTDTIRWSAYNIPKVRLDYTTNNGANWILIRDTLLGSLQKYAWTIPNTPSAQCKVRATDVSFPSRFDMSDTVFTISISPSVTLISPNGGEQWRARETHTIRWSSAGIEKVNIRYSTDNGANWLRIVDSLNAAAASFQWLIPDTPSEFCLVRITDAANAARYDQSDSEFSILPPKLLTVLYPNGSDTTVYGDTLNISWSAANVLKVRLEYTTDNGGSFLKIADSVAFGSTPYKWVVPDVVSSNCRIRISDASNSAISDVSDAVFSIVRAAINITSPGAGVKWKAGTSRAIEWTKQYVTGDVKLEYSINSGTEWTAIATVAGTATGYQWTVPQSASAQCKVRISPLRYNYAAAASQIFSIVVAQLNLTAAGAGPFVYGETAKWKLTRQNVNSVKAELSIDDGNSWRDVTTALSNDTLILRIQAAEFPQGSDYTCRIRVSDNELPSVADTKSFSVLKPSITMLRPVGDEYWQNGRAYMIQWKDALFDSVIVEYSKDGVTWNTMRTVLSDSIIHSTQWMTGSADEGTYRIRVQNRNKAVCDVSAVSESFVLFTYKPSVRVEPEIDTKVPVSFGAYQDESSFRMAGWPGNQNQALDQIFSGTYGKEWRAFRDNGAASNYLEEFDASSNRLSFGPGLGYWVYSRNSYMRKDSIVSCPLSYELDSIPYFAIPVRQNAWNIISNPFEKRISWQDVRNLNGLPAADSLWAFESRYKKADSLKPYEAYYYFNARNISSLKIPYFSNAAPAVLSKLQKQQAATAGEFRIVLRAGSADISSGITVGTNMYASQGYDGFDVLYPPADFEQYRIVIVNNEYDLPYKKLRREVKPVPEHGLRFDFEVKKPRNTAAVLEVEETIRGEYDAVYILDNDAKAVHDLAKSRSIPLNHTRQYQHYSIVYGSREYVDSELKSLLPTEYALFQNYPNPFNPVTSISFALPEAGRVTLTVYNLLGEKIECLVDAGQEAGYHEVSFSAGRYSSGVYFYELRAGGGDGESYRAVKRMCVIK